MLCLIDLNSTKLGRDEFVMPIARLLSNYEIKHYTEEIDLEKYDKIILSGTALKDDEYLKHDFGFLKDYKKPVLGICAGMQVIGKLFGGEIFECREIGMRKIKSKKNNGLLDDEFEAYELHKNAVKGNFLVFAKNENCAQAIRINNFYGIMFHPEARNNKVIERFSQLKNES